MHAGTSSGKLKVDSVVFGWAWSKMATLYLKNQFMIWVDFLNVVRDILLLILNVGGPLQLYLLLKKNMTLPYAICSKFFFFLKNKFHSRIDVMWGKHVSCKLITSSWSCFVKAYEQIIGAAIAWCFEISHSNKILDQRLQWISVMATLPF